MSGTASVPFTIAAFFTTGKERIIYCFLAIACFVLASYLIWKKERDARMVLEDEKKPKLRLEFLGENDPRYYRKVDQYKYKICISVHNDSDISISDIDVTCDEVMALTMDATIVPLHVISERDTFGLHARQHEFRTVFQHKLDDTNRPGHIEVLARSPIRTNETIQSSGFRLRIAARGKEGMANPIWITCWVTDRTVHAKREL